MGFARSLGKETLAAEEIARRSEKQSKTGVEAARKKFTPEFMNRLDKIVVFKSLADKDLRRILDIELAIFQQRLLAGANQKKFVFAVSDDAKTFLLEQGVDPRYGARHLKRSMERLLVQPLSNLLATEQIEDGDCLRIEFDSVERELTFTKEAEGLPIGTMFEMIDTSVPVQLGALAAAVSNDHPKLNNSAAASKLKGKV
jgi:ATP-dependent Clp protease ATP-binding subunit ClpA